MKIAFTYPKKPTLFSKLIVWFTKSNWSHCLLIPEEEFGDDPIIIESNAYGGVRIDLLSKYDDKYNIEIYEELKSDNNLNPLKPYIGNKYGYFQIVGFVVSKIFKLKNNIFGSGEICSELVLLYLLGSRSKKLFQNLQKNATSPEDLYRIISKKPSYFKKSDV